MATVRLIVVPPLVIGYILHITDVAICRHHGLCNVMTIKLTQGEKCGITSLSKWACILMAESLLDMESEKVRFLPRLPNDTHFP